MYISESFKKIVKFIKIDQRERNQKNFWGLWKQRQK